MRVLVACERSGRVRDALIRRGHDAISCDIEPSDLPGPHILGRAEEHLDGWDMLIGFPPCTYLSNINTPCTLGRCPHRAHDALWRQHRRRQAIDAALLFHVLRDAAPMTAVENPQPNPLASILLGRHTSHTEPYWFGHPWRKRTFWWLRGLTPLSPTTPVHPTHRLVDTGTYIAASGEPTLDGIDPPRSKAVNSLPGLSKDAKVRSETPLGLAEAIAGQWGDPNPQTLFTA